MSDKILNSDEMRFRIIDMEYNNLSEEEFIERLELIYIEEKGEKLPAEVEIFHSSDSQELEMDESGYDGTAIYFHSEENDISEMYVISQGSQDLNDWEYNIKAMFAGRDSAQAEATNTFVNEAKEEFNLFEEEPVIGLSHSLGNNNNVTAHLASESGIFDEIYSINGAQANYYQLYFLDTEFQLEVVEHFPISIFDPDAIYNLDPAELQAFAEDFYADQAENIHQTISLDDPLYAVSGQRGFFTLGEVDYIDTNPDHPGLREIIDDIPDEVVRDFQDLAIQYTVSSKEGGLDQAMYDILGVDMDFVNELLEIEGIGSGVWAYVTNQDELDTLIRNLNDNVPDLMSKITTITNNSDLIFGRLEEAGYITGAQKELLITEITKMETELLGIQEALESNVNTRDSGDFWEQVGGDLGGGLKIYGHITALQDSLAALGQEEFLEILEMIGDSHGIPEVLEAFSTGNKSYMGADMILTATQGKKEIQVNMSAALRMYQQGMDVLSEKELEIVRLGNAVDEEIKDAFLFEKRRVQWKINAMEQSPNLYNYLLTKHGLYPTFSKKIKSIRVHEVLYPLEQADLDQELQSLKETVEKGQLQIEGYRKAVESLFEEDEKISNQFDLIRGV